MSQHDLLIIEHSEPLPMKEIDSLQRKGYSVTICKDFATLDQTLTNLNKPIVLLNCAAKLPSQPFLDRICAKKNLHSCPVMVLAVDVSGLESKLNKIFPLAVAIKKPAAPAKLLEAVRFLERNYRTSKPVQEVEEQDTPTVEIDPEKTLVLESGIAKPVVPAPIYAPEDFDGAPPSNTAEKIQSASDLFAAIQDSRLLQSNIGGAVLPPMLSGRAIEESAVEIPQRADLRGPTTEYLLSLKPSSRTTLERINILTLKLLAPLPLEAQMLDLAKAASVLYAQAFANTSRTLLTRDYSFKGAIVLRKDICSAIKDSALNAMQDFSDRDLGQIISLVGKLIGQEEKSSRDSLSLVASAIVAADLVNRICFQSPIWNTSAAYGLIRKIRKGRASDLHPAVVCLLLKLLAEALTSPANQKMMPFKRYQPEHDKKSEESEDSDYEPPVPHPKEFKKAPETELSPLVEGEEFVELPALTAGMRLSRPLQTQDGQDILAEDLVLDQDLILRIWQLSAIRVLNKAVIRQIH